MAFFSSPQIEAMEQRYRATFINSLGGFKSVVMVGTSDSNGATNLSIFSSLFHIGANPPLCGLIFRPDSVERHTLSNIESTGVYTINHVNHSFLDLAHQTSAKYPEEVSEFDEVGLTPEFIEATQAPFVKESKVKYALTLEEIIPIQLNNTFLVIGKLQHVKFEEDILSTDGFLQLDKVDSLCSNGVDAYYSTQLIDRYEYARPGTRAQKMEK
jgi:flavin reductase (DIM6/NTAB) family NADH-FMN oxidoreductase RutF